MKCMMIWSMRFSRSRVRNNTVSQPASYEAQDASLCPKAGRSLLGVSKPPYHPAQGGPRRHGLHKILRKPQQNATPALPSRLHASSGSCSAGLFGFTSSAVAIAAWQPIPTRSSRKLAPRQSAPWSEAQSASPAATNLGTIVFSAMPPMLRCTVGNNGADDNQQAP